MNAAYPSISWSCSVETSTMSHLSSLPESAPAVPSQAPARQMAIRCGPGGLRTAAHCNDGYPTLQNLTRASIPGVDEPRLLVVVGRATSQLHPVRDRVDLSPSAAPPPVADGASKSAAADLAFQTVRFADARGQVSPMLLPSRSVTVGVVGSAGGL